MHWLGDIGLSPATLHTDPGPMRPTANATAFHCRVGDHRIEGVLRSTDLGWLAQAAAAAARQGPPRLERLAALRLPVAAVLGRRRLPLQLLRSLATGDMVLLDRPTGPQDIGSTALLVLGRRGRGAIGWPCAVRGHEITTVGERWMNTETLEPGAVAGHDAQAARDRRGGVDPIAELEVDLHLELQVLSTPLADLAAMRPGYVLELPVPAAQASVDLVVGGQVYGRAQLVVVGDRLGARILELFHADP
jgi:type III secretion protein Q